MRLALFCFVATARFVVPWGCNLTREQRSNYFCTEFRVVAGKALNIAHYCAHHNKVHYLPIRTFTRCNKYKK